MEGMTQEAWQLRPVTVEEIVALRSEVLWPGRELLRFEADAVGWHFGAFLGDGRNIGCLTLMEVPWEGQRALQLRGMAVAADWQGKGVGTGLLNEAARYLEGIKDVAHLGWWCNARVPAIAFYERNGWRVASEEFEIAGAGPHRKMMTRGLSVARA
jgi:GNAT superfamily N-acetyltransferase